jgi:opacity protein-like surface antigen
MSYQVTIFDTVKTYRMQLTEEQVHHHQPVRFGLSLRYQFDNRWSVETGISYTRLTSDYLKNVDNVFTSKTVHTDYIGLPLHVGYQLWSGRYVGVYTLAGGMVEKALDNTMWQFSLNGAAGVEFKLNGLFSIYAEPGLGYYFDNRSSTPTLYQEKPLNFNLGLGLRFLFK